MEPSARPWPLRSWWANRRGSTLWGLVKTLACVLRALWVGGASEGDRLGTSGVGRAEEPSGVSGPAVARWPPPAKALASPLLGGCVSSCGIGGPPRAGGRNTRIPPPNGMSDAAVGAAATRLVLCCCCWAFRRRGWRREEEESGAGVEGVDAGKGCCCSKARRPAGTICWA